MKPPFAVIFDMNGVIIDDLPYHKKAWFEIASRLGKTLTEDEFNRKLSGRTNAETFSYLLNRELPLEEIRRLEIEKESLYRELYAAHRALLPGLENFLAELKENNIPTAVATAAPPENVTFIFEGLKLQRYFNTVVDASLVKRGKPDPEIFLLAASKLGSEPKQCVVFEDAVLGTEAARRAGMKVVGVTTTSREEDLGKVNLFIRDFNEMNYKILTNLFA